MDSMRKWGLVWILSGLLLAGCSSDGDGAGGGGGEGEGEGVLIDLCGGACLCDQACNEDTGSCEARQCRALADAECPDSPVFDCDDDKEVCRQGRCVVPPCASNADCGLNEAGESTICLEGKCVAGCKESLDCPMDAGTSMPGACRPDPEREDGLGRCDVCGCRSDVDCDVMAGGGVVFACAVAPEDPAINCLCEQVECRCGRGDCGSGEVCNCNTNTCVSESCTTDDDCEDPHKHCRTDVGVCVCADNQTRGECPEDDCGSTRFCQQTYGDTFVCDDDHKCGEQPCTGPTDCPVLGTACNLESGYCGPKACDSDADCPRRADIEPMPSGVFYCDDGSGTCAQGCRDSNDCPDSRRCNEETRTCDHRLCVAPADCARGRWCNTQSRSRPEGAADNEGICEQGCDESADCAQGQPCRLDVHVCGCRTDDDCAIIDPEFVCDESSTCVPPCIDHDDCGVAAACVLGHCLEGACRNDIHEPNDVIAEAIELGLVANEEEENSSSGTFDLRLCSQPADQPNAPVDFADWFVFDLDNYEELEIEIVWPLVDTDGDGMGDTPGVCNIEEHRLAVSLWAGIEGRREWPRPNQTPYENPGPGEPCRLVAGTHAPALTPTAYYLAVEMAGQMAQTLDYKMTVTHARSVACAPDDWEPNNLYGSASSVFNCEEFLLQGGHLDAPQQIESLTFCRDDVDWYEIWLREEDRVRITATYDSRLGELRGLLRHPAEWVDPDDVGAFPFEDASGVDGELEIMHGDGLFNDIVVDGAYLLQLLPASLNQEFPLETDYDLWIACEGPRIPCRPDIQENNDAADEATCIYTDGQGNCGVIGEAGYVWEPGPAADPEDRSLHLCAEGGGADGKDEDWYRIDVIDGAQVRVQTTNDLGPGNIWFLELQLLRYDGAEAVIVGQSASPRSLNEINAIDLDAGAYYLRVAHPLNVQDRTVPYDLQIRVFGGAEECIEDLFEENDDLANARDLSDDVMPSLDVNAPYTCFPLDNPNSSMALCDGDAQGREEDWYKLDLTDVITRRLDVQVRCVDPDGGDIDLEVRGPDGLTACPLQEEQCRDHSPTCVGENPDLASDDDDGYAQIHLTGNPMAAQPYYLRVFGDGSPQNEYRLCVRVIADICDDDGQEPNDTCRTARPLPVNTNDWQARQVCPGDEDWFQIQLPEASDVRVEVDFDGFREAEVQLFDKFVVGANDCRTMNPMLGCNDPNYECNTLVELEGDSICWVQEDLPADEYFLRVFGFPDPAEQGYFVRIWTGPPGTLSCAQ